MSVTNVKSKWEDGDLVFYDSSGDLAKFSASGGFMVFEQGISFDGTNEISETEIEYLDTVTAGTITASKAVVVDANKDIASFRNVTLTGTLTALDVDATGQLNIDSDIAGGASVGNVIKLTGAAGETYTGTNAALTIKNYDEDNTVVHSGGENAGMAVFAKFLSEPTDGGENVIATFHQHSSSTANPKHGVVVYGDMTNGIAVSGGTCTSAINLENQTVTNLFKLAAGSEARVASESCDNVASDGAIKVDVGGTDYFIPLFAAGNVTNSW